MMDDFAQSGVHDETARNLIASVNGGISPIGLKSNNNNLFNQAGAQPSYREEESEVANDELALMWPSQKPTNVEPREALQHDKHFMQKFSDEGPMDDQEN